MALDDKCPVGGAAAKLKEDDFNNPVYVDMCEEVGEKTFRPGTKMREDVFMTRYTQDQRKTMNVKKEVKFNRKSNKMETFYRIFDDVDGVERFELFESSSARKRQKVHDDIVGDAFAGEAEASFEDAAAELLQMGQHKSCATKADVGFVEQRESKFENEGKGKKKLAKHLSLGSSSSCTSSSLNFRTCGGLVKKHSTKAKGKAKAKPRSATSPSTAGTPTKAAASPGNANATDLASANFSGYDLDSPTATKDKNFVKQLDLKLREGDMINAVLLHQVT